MATVSFLWHLHQPAYRTADGLAHAPWVALHAGGSYATLSRAIIEAGGRGQVLNIVPTLLEQLEHYRDRTVNDPVVEALICPSSELTVEARSTLLEWGFHLPQRQLDRYPRLRELASRRSSGRTTERLTTLYGPGDLRDLQILFLLALAGERAWRDERLAELHEQGSHFATEDHERAIAWFLAQPGELLELWQTLASQTGVEISTSPYAHPIMPLLVDSAVVEDSWAPQPAPQVPDFRHPEDARWQLRAGLELMRGRGFNPTGCWPPEGSVSEDAVRIYDDAGVRWLVTDEGILERSLERSLRPGSGMPALELYQPWRIDGSATTLLFRDRWLSDTIGFVFGHWDDETRAAHAFLEHLRGLARQLPEEAAIVIALDGENPWLHYPEGGGTFLRTVMQGLNNGEAHLDPVTLQDLVERVEPRTLPRLHPGSWINSIFATWIGHPEKTHAWEVLTAVRETLAASEVDSPPSLLLAEGSDWFWWLGDDNPTPLAPLYDRIFRLHLADACAQAGVEPPVDLDEPLKTVTRPLQVPVSEVWPAPVLDGRITTYFEWSLAAWLEAVNSEPLRRLAAWSDTERLYLLVEGETAMQQLINGDRLIVRLQSPEGTVLAVNLSPHSCGQDGLECAVGKVVELALPWDARPGYRLEVRLGGQQLPDGAVLLLEPLVVDEELTASGP